MAQDNSRIRDEVASNNRPTLRCRAGRYASGTFAVALMAASALATDAAVACSNADAVWVADDDTGRTVLRTPEGPAWGWIASFERWEKGARVWQLDAEISCSLGQGICQVAVPNMMGAKDETENLTNAVVERIDENDDDVSDWIIFAGLGENLYYGGGANVIWSPGFDQVKRIQIPNIFQLAGCRNSSNDASWQSMIYAIEPVCQMALRTQTVEEFSRYGEHASEGLWWMNDKKSVGWEFECLIDRWNPDLTISLTCSGEGSKWNEIQKVRQVNEERILDGLRLRQCVNK